MSYDSTAEYKLLFGNIEYIDSNITDYYQNIYRPNITMKEQLYEITIINYFLDERKKELLELNNNS